jgi:tetratricopeptide (TPR) repeat protein
MRLAALLLFIVCVVPAQVTGPDQLFREAVAAQQRGDNALAIRKYQELLKLRPDVVEVRANLGASLARAGRFDEAIEQYRVALARSGNNPVLRLNLALAYYKKNDWTAATPHLKILHEAEPANARVATLLADCYSHAGQDAEIIKILSPVLDRHPDNLAVAWELGSALIRNGRSSEGLGLVERVAISGNRAEAYLLAGRTALQLNQFERARDDAATALRLDAKLPGALTLYGTVLQYLNDNQGAMVALRQALEANPNDFDAHLTLGAVLNTERDLEGARKHLERAVALNPASTLALYSLARMKRTQGEIEASVRDFEKVVRDDPDWAQPHIELAALYFRLNRQAEGEKERATFDRLSANQQGKPSEQRPATRAPSH